MSFAPHYQRLQKTLQAPLVFHLPNPQTTTTTTRSSMRPTANPKTNPSQICGSANPSNNVSNPTPVDTRRPYVHSRSETSTTNNNSSNQTVWPRDKLSLRHVRNREMYASLEIDKIDEILKRLVSYGFETSADIAKMQPWQLRVLKKSTPQIDRIYLQAFPVWGANEYYDDYTNKARRQFVDCAVWLEHNEVYLIIASFYLGADDPKLPKIPGYKCFICQHEKDLTSLDELRWHIWLHHRQSPDIGKAMAESRERYWNFVDLSALNRTQKRGPVIDLCVDSDSDDNAMTTHEISTTHTKRSSAVSSSTQRLRSGKSQSTRETSSRSSTHKNNQSDNSKPTRTPSQANKAMNFGGVIPAIDAMNGSVSSGIMNVGHFHPVTRRSDDMIMIPMELPTQINNNNNNNSNSNSNHNHNNNNHNNNHNYNYNNNNNSNNSSNHNTMEVEMGLDDIADIKHMHYNNNNEDNNNNGDNTGSYGFEMGFMTGPDWFGDNDLLSGNHYNSSSNHYHDPFGNDFMDDNGPMSGTNGGFGFNSPQATPPSWPSLFGDSFSNGA